MTVSLHSLLKTMVEKGGTDLHITTNSPPLIRIDGTLVTLSHPPMTAVDTKKLAYSVLTDAQKHRFEETLELDISFGVKGLARFRANVYMQRGAVAGAFRRIPYEILGFRELGLPASVEALCSKPRGLVLVTGPTGSGKSTTLAALIDKINREKALHILTIEDPVEYLHSHKKCMVNQRELHADTHSFPNALRSVLREDPDVVLIGEMRDLETIESALRIAETGHLTFATLHTNSAPQTINLRRASGKGRCLVCEVLSPSPAIRNLIREDKIHQVYSMMQAGQVKHGMQTFNQALSTLYQRRLISLQVALAYSSYPDELQDMINRGVGAINTAPEARRAGRS
jgi:twitching motility protein PilT